MLRTLRTSIVDRASRLDMRRLTTFVLVGASGAGAYVVLASLLSLAGLVPWMASVCAQIGVLPPTYLAQKRLTFRSTASDARAFPRYVGVQCLNLVIAAAGSEAATRVGLPPPLAFALVAIVVAVTSYLLLKAWSFGAP